MSDKQQVARVARKKQRALEIKQKESLGMRTESSIKDLDKSAIRFPELVAETKDETQKQNGRLEAVEVSLVKESVKRKEYEEMRKQNDMYLDYTQS